MTLVVYKSPHLLTVPLKDGFFGVINTWHPDSTRILNTAQFELLKAIDGSRSVESICSILNLDVDTVKKLIQSLTRGEILKYDNFFGRPVPPTIPKTLNLWLHTTNRCNLTCNYCYISTLNTEGGMDERVKRNLIANLVYTAVTRKLSKIKIRLAGGEPLTQFKKWKNFILTAKSDLNKIGCELNVAFITNLTILDDDILDFAVKSGVTFGISLDGVGFYHDLTRKNHSGKGTFDIVNKNLEIVKERGIKTSVSTVITNQNMEGLSALTEYLIEKEFNFRFSIVKGVNIDRLRLKTYLNNAYKVMDQAVDNGWGFTKFHKFCDLKPNELGYQTCSSGLSGGAIYIDGGVYYCHVQFGDSNKSVGNASEKDTDLVALISKGQHYEGLKSDDCTDCHYRYICTSGCPMYRVDGKDPNCAIYHEFLPKIFEIQAKERLNMLLKRNNKVS